MAKYRHRIFEMYDFRDEAIVALTPAPAADKAEAAPSPPAALKHLAVSNSAGTTLVEFKKSTAFEEETVSELRADFASLAEKLIRNSVVLVDFSSAESFCAAAIDELVLFKQKLRTKGSRIALCCLEPAVKESFFAVRPL